MLQKADNKPMKVVITASFAALLVLSSSLRGLARTPPTEDDCQRPGAFEGGVFRIGGRIQPPVPLHTTQPVRPEGTRFADIQGIVSLSLVVDVTGCPVIIRVEHSLDTAIDETVVNAIKTWRFQPATLDGKQVRVWITIQVKFQTSKTAEYMIINSKSP